MQNVNEGILSLTAEHPPPQAVEVIGPYKKSSGNPRGNFREKLFLQSRILGRAVSSKSGEVEKNCQNQNPGGAQRSGRVVPHPASKCQKSDGTQRSGRVVPHPATPNFPISFSKMLQNYSHINSELFWDIGGGRGNSPYIWVKGGWDIGV